MATPSRRGRPAASGRSAPAAATGAAPGRRCRWPRAIPTTCRDRSPSAAGCGRRDRQGGVAAGFPASAASRPAGALRRGTRARHSRRPAGRRRGWRCRLHRGSCRRGVRGGQPHFDGGMGELELRQARQQPAQREGGRRVDADDLPARRRTCSLVASAMRSKAAVISAVGASRCRQRNPAAVPQEQCMADPVLELGHVPAHRAVRDAQLRGGGAEARAVRRLRTLSGN